MQLAGAVIGVKGAKDRLGGLGARTKVDWWGILFSEEGYNQNEFRQLSSSHSLTLQSYGGRIRCI